MKVPASKQIEFNSLVDSTRLSKRSSFYRTIWGGGGPIPIDRSKFEDTPLAGRLYRSPKGFTRIVHGPSPFLILRGLDDLRSEPLNSSCKRPLVLFLDSGESIEKSLWFYEHDVVPIAGEHSAPEATVLGIRQLGVDAIIADLAMARMFTRSSSPDFLREIPLTLCERHVAPDAVLELMATYKSLQVVLTSPETGAFAVSCPSLITDGACLFHVTRTSIVEFNGVLRITRLLELPTPIIRYESGFFAKPATATCGCAEKEESFVLL